MYQKFGRALISKCFYGLGAFEHETQRFILFFKLLLSDHMQYVYTDVPYTRTGLH